jgi:hypothetical protein
MPGRNLHPSANMRAAPMNLKVLLPFQIFADKTGVLRIVAETREGSFGLLPHRLDCVAALAPGILTYETTSDGEVFVAVDEGVSSRPVRTYLYPCAGRWAERTSGGCAKRWSESF